MKTVFKPFLISSMILFIAAFSTVTAQDQKKYAFAIHADPLVSWIHSGSADYASAGTVAGINFGIDIRYPLAPTFALTSGISFLSTGGRQTAAGEHTMVFNNIQPVVAAGEEMIYRLKYLNIPAGVLYTTDRKKETDFFADGGVDIRVLLSSSVDIPSEQISGESAGNEVFGLNLGWHISGGVMYGLGKKTFLMAGLGLDSDLFDITEDISSAGQPSDRSLMRMVRLRFGLKF